MLVYASRFAYGELTEFTGDPDWNVPDSSGMSIVPGWNAATALRIVGTQVAELTVAPSAQSATLIIQAAVMFDAFEWADTFLSIEGGGDAAMSLQIAASGGLALLDHDGDEVATVPEGTLLPGQFHYLELKVQRDGAARIQLRIDGVLWLDAQGLNALSTGTLDAVVLGAERMGTTWSELVVLDGMQGPDDRYNDFLGSATRIDDGYLRFSNTLPRGPNPLRELLGYLDARSNARSAPARRKTWRVEGALLLDDPATRATRLVRGSETSLVSLAQDATQWSPPGWAGATVVVVTPTGGARVIHSADPWVTEDAKFILNAGAFSLTLEHNGAGPLDARFLLPSSSDIDLDPGEGCYVVRDPLSARWRATRGFVGGIDTDPSDLIALL